MYAFSLLNNELGIIKNDISTTLDSSSSVDDVGGYAVITSSVGYSFGVVIALIAGAVGILGIGYSIILIVFLIIARIVYGQSKGRIIAYRILMGVDYLLLSVAVVLITIGIVNSFSTIMFFIDLYLIIILIICIKNTYTKRIYIPENDNLVTEKREV